MPLVGAWFKVWIYLGFLFGWTMGARPRFDTSTDMGLVLIPADAEVDSVIFRLRATDQDADFPLIFEITATITPVVRIENLPCTLYNKVCQANVILTKRLVPGRLHDFAVRVRDSKGDSNSMQATISVTNATTQRDKIFPHIPSLIMVPEDTKPGKELDYLLVRANSWSGKPVYIELWQPKELFTIRQRQTPSQTRGVITLIGELDFETQSMYTLTMYATDPYTEAGKDTRNIAGLNVVVVVQDVQDVPPIFTLAPPLTRLNNSVQPGEVILRVHAEDGDKGVPREIAYGLVSEGNPFTPFFNISETTGEIVLARPLEELTQITHVGAPVVLSVVAEEIRRTREEPPAQATVVEVGLLLGEPGNSPPYFESDTYVTVIEENLEPGTIITFGDQYSTRVRDEDIGKAGVFALKLENNNGTFEITPTVAERTADFIITVRDNTFIDYETYKSLIFKIVAQEVGPATNLLTSVPVTIYLRDVNDNPPVFEQDSYEVTLSENVTAGTRVVQVHATDKDTGDFGRIQYTRIIGQGSEAFTMDSDTGLITVAMGSSLDREMAPRLQLSVEARDENGNGNRGIVPLIVNLLDVNDNVPTFEKTVYVFLLNSDLTNFTAPAMIKATDADAEPPNNVIRYEIIHGNYENKFYLNEVTGELILRSPISKVRRKKQSANERLSNKSHKELHRADGHRESIAKTNRTTTTTTTTTTTPTTTRSSLRESKLYEGNPIREKLLRKIREALKIRRKRADDDALFTLTARAYDLGVPHLSSLTQISIIAGGAGEDRIVMFVLPEEHPDPVKTAKTLATITGAKVTVQEIRPYVAANDSTNMPNDVKKSVVVARVEKSTAFVDVEKIRETLAANGVGLINASVMMPDSSGKTTSTSNITNTVTSVHNEEVTVYKAENKLLIWLLIVLGLLMLLAIAVLIICCICPACPFYMAPRKRRVQSSETLIVRSDGRPKRHLHRKQPTIVHVTNSQERKQAWSADPTRRNWQFNRRNVKNCGLASLPGDVAYVSGNDARTNVESFEHHRDARAYDPSGRISGQDRMYVEDIESLKMREYHVDDRDSLARHELEQRGSDLHRRSYRYEDEREMDVDERTTIREQHFYREGNAEILRLVTRGEDEDNGIHRQGATMIVDGKDILLKRFMEDQKMRQDASSQDQECTRSVESIQRVREPSHPQPEIILIPQTLNIGQGQRVVEESGPAVQRLLIDRLDFEGTPKEKTSHIGETQTRQESTMQGGVSESIERPTMSSKDHGQSVNVQSYSFHEMELARQNALLTRLLLERETRAGGPVMMDSSSYLETQSLPGQVAIATQTDRTAATQTERQVRSRSDNDDSEEESRVRKKMKTKKRYESDSKRTRTLWTKSPIEEEGGGGSPCFDKRLSILRKRVKEVKDQSRKISIEPEVLREISDSLDGNGSSGRGDEKETKTYERSTEETSIRYEILNEEDNGSPSSVDVTEATFDKVFSEKTRQRGRDEKKGELDKEESTSSDVKERPEKSVDKETDGTRKESKKTQKKNESKPTFRILEREITMFTKKLSKLGEKKTQESNGSEDAYREKVSTTGKKGSRKDTDQRTTKTSRTKVSTETISGSGSKAGVESTTSQRKEGGMTRLRQKLKYQQARVMSTGSSEVEDARERSRKESLESGQENVKEKQPTATHAKVKRQSQTEQRKEMVALKDQESDRRRELPRERTKLESKFGKLDKSAGRSQKAVSTLQKESLSEEFSTSTSSDRTESKRESGPRRAIEKKRGGTGSSDNAPRQVGQRKSRKIRVHQMGERTTEVVAKDSEREDLERRQTSGDDKNEIKKERSSVGAYEEEKRKMSVVKSDSDNTREKEKEKEKERDRVVSLKEALKDFVGFGRGGKRVTSEEQAFSDNFEEVPGERATSRDGTESVGGNVIDRLEMKSTSGETKRDNEKETDKGETSREADDGTRKKLDVAETSIDIEKDIGNGGDRVEESLERPKEEKPRVDKRRNERELDEESRKEIRRVQDKEKEKEKEKMATVPSTSTVDETLPETVVTSSTSVDAIHEGTSLRDNGEAADSKDETEVSKVEIETTVKEDIEKFWETEMKDGSSGDDNKLVSKLVDTEKEKKSLDQPAVDDKKLTKDVIEFVEEISQIALSKRNTEETEETEKTSPRCKRDEEDGTRYEEDTSGKVKREAFSFEEKDTTKMMETVLKLESRRSSPQESDREKLESEEASGKLEKSGRDEISVDSLGITGVEVKSNGLGGDFIRVSAEVHKEEVGELSTDKSHVTEESETSLTGLRDEDGIDTLVSQKGTEDALEEKSQSIDAVETSLAKNDLDGLETKEKEISAERDEKPEDAGPSTTSVRDESSESVQREVTDVKSKEELTISSSEKVATNVEPSGTIEERKETEDIPKELSKETENGKSIEGAEISKDVQKDSMIRTDTELEKEEKFEATDVTRQPASEPPISEIPGTEELSTIEKDRPEEKPIKTLEDVKVERAPIDPIVVEKPSKPPTPMEELGSVEEQFKEETDKVETNRKKTSESIESVGTEPEGQLKVDEKLDSGVDEKRSSEISSPDKIEEKEEGTRIESKQVKEESRISLERSKEEPSKEEPSRKEPSKEADELEERANETSVQPGEKLAKEEVDKGVSREEGMEEYENVSPTIFTSIIDTLDDSDESDSSSDISRKTTLTTMPYQTPRHRPREVRDDNANLSGDAKRMESSSDFEDVDATIEMTEDRRESREIMEDASKLVKTMVEDVELNKKSEIEESTARKVLVTKEPSSSNAVEKRENKNGSEKTKTIAEPENGKSKRAIDDSKRQTGKSNEAKDKSVESDKHMKKLEKDSRGRKRYAERPRVAVRKEKREAATEEGSEVKEDRSPDKAPRRAKGRFSKVGGSRLDKKENEKEKKERETEKGKGTSKRTEEDQEKRSRSRKPSSNGEKSSSPPKTNETEAGKPRSKYMAWYTQKREEMEKKREVKRVEEEDDRDQLPRWLKRSLAHRRSIPDEKKKTPEITPRTRRKVKPLVNVESEQLKAIVRQGRKMRKAEGGRYEDPPIQIFASTPPTPPPQEQKPQRHHLFQHSEYKYEKIPAPFYLHPPPAPHPSPQLSPEHFDPQRPMEFPPPEENIDVGITVSMPTGTRLRHQQLLEKKSVFDIAYSEAAPSQLRADSTTPPS